MLTLLGSFKTNVFNQGAAEIPAYDPATRRTYVVNGASDRIDILDTSNPSNPVKIGEIDYLSNVGAGFASANSVAVKNGIVAIAIEAATKTAPGAVAFYNTSGTFLGQVKVGAQPDMVTFTPNGTKVLTANEGELAEIDASNSMALGENGFQVLPLFTIGKTFSGTTGALNPTTAGSYTPPGILDGLGAYELNPNTVRVFANHELAYNRGYDYQVSNGSGGFFTLDGARVSYFDIDKSTRQIVDTGLAYNTIYDANGNVATNSSFLANNLPGFSRFCSGQYVPSQQFGSGRGLQNGIYFTGEEDGGTFSTVGGGMWALDPATGYFWHVPAFGRGAWENLTEIDTGTTTHVAFILSDDTSPFDADGVAGNEAAPLYLYVGQKQSGDFLAQNGLRGGKLYVWKANNGNTLPSQFNGDGATRAGTWVEIDNTPSSMPSEDGSTGFDEYGYPTQKTLFTRAKAAGAFGFSRPEDVSTNPNDGSEVVLASTGVDDYDGGSDTFGTTYLIDTTFNDSAVPTSGTVTILYDGNADVANRALRSPDNLDWADDGYIYVQEDKAEEQSLTGEKLFGAGATNPNEASIVRIDPNTGNIERVAEINRSAVLDASLANPKNATDKIATNVGGWESSGILDVSTLFGEAPGTLFLFDIQAHGINGQASPSRINNNDLVEGGQLAFLQANPEGSVSIIDIASGANSASPVSTASFAGFNGQEDALRAQGVRITQGNAVSQDVEPEYIAISADGTTAYVTLQENNAVATVNIATATVTGIAPLGLKNHGTFGNGLDGSDRDGPGTSGKINIATYANVFGMYMPDAIAAYTSGGQTYLVTANEGDDRDDFIDPNETTSVSSGSYVLDPTVFPNAATLKNDDFIGRLTVSRQTIDGDTNGDNDFDRIQAYGARSFSIWNASGALVFDSGDDFERITAALYPANFNANHTSNTFDNRSDNKGPEPEGVALGTVGNRTYAFIGLERIGGVMVYDITDPTAPEFMQYINNRNFAQTPGAGTGGDLGPEGLQFVSAADSPTGKPLLIVANEVSGSTSFYEFDAPQNIPTPVSKLPVAGGGQLVSGLSTADYAEGTNNADTLSGFNGDDTLAALGGNDYMDGGAGNDSLDGGDGKDTLNGGIGNDTLRGRDGNDTLNGGAGNDLVKGDAGNDSLVGQDGDDTLIGAAATTTPGLGEIDTLVGGNGADTFVLGDLFRAFYIDGSATNPSTGDYALIQDFLPAAGDRIQLNNDYSYNVGSFQLGTQTRAAIYADTDGTAGLSANDDLIAVFQNLSPGAAATIVSGFVYV